MKLFLTILALAAFSSCGMNDSSPVNLRGNSIVDSTNQDQGSGDVTRNDAITVDTGDQTQVITNTGNDTTGNDEDPSANDNNDDGNDDPPPPVTRGLLTQDPNNPLIWEFVVDVAEDEDWNTVANTVEMRGGETLRVIFNQPGHAFHSGNPLCRHGGNRQYDVNGNIRDFSSTGEFEVGEFTECDIPANVQTRDFGGRRIYSHGDAGRFYFRTID